MGAYIAEGWAENSRAFISGKDGHWKEATKTRAEAYAESRGWASRWHDKYIALNGAEAAAFVGECGKGALNKRIPASVLAEGNLAALDDGLKLDASQNTHGGGWTLGTVSRHLAVQYRVLQRMQGRSTSMKMVSQHGGYGSNPIYRVGVRQPAEGYADKRLLVSAIYREVEEVPVYDITTDDHYVYLPESDVTVSNCDDMVLLLCSLFESVNLPWKQVLSGQSEQGKVRYIEGEQVPQGVSWSHIYCMVGTPPFQPNKWFFCEPTVQGVPLGWDVINGDHRFLPELVKQKRGGVQHVMPSPQAPLWHSPSKLPRPENRSTAYDAAYGGPSALSAAVGASIASEMEDSTGSMKWKGAVIKYSAAIFTGVAVSVGTQLALDWIRGTGRWAPSR
jgi:hypothetical protein